MALGVITSFCSEIENKNIRTFRRYEFLTGRNYGSTFRIILSTCDFNKQKTRLLNMKNMFLLEIHINQLFLK